MLGNDKHIVMAVDPAVYGAPSGVITRMAPQPRTQFSFASMGKMRMAFWAWDFICPAVIRVSMAVFSVDSPIIKVPSWVWRRQSREISSTLGSAR